MTNAALQPRRFPIQFTCRLFPRRAVVTIVPQENAMKKQDSRAEDQRLYLGVDIGGTKVQASLVRESGEIIGRRTCPTPRKGGPERVVAAIEKCMDDMVRKGGISPDDLTAIGIAVPGVVDPDRGMVVVAPNMPLTGVALGSLLEARFKAPIVIGNDGNFGALGETWLGSARNARARCTSAWARASAADWCSAASCGAAIANRPARSAT